MVTVSRRQCQVPPRCLQAPPGAGAPGRPGPGPRWTALSLRQSVGLPRPGFGRSAGTRAADRGGVATVPVTVASRA